MKDDFKVGFRDQTTNNEIFQIRVAQLNVLNSTPTIN